MAKIHKKSSAKSPAKTVGKAGVKAAAKVKQAKAAAKPVVSSKLRTAKKGSEKASKAAAHDKSSAKPSLAKTVAGAVGKLFSKEKADTKAKALASVDLKPSKKEKVLKKKAKKGKEGLNLEEDDLLASDEEIGSEEIPDLSEFDENEEAEVTEEPTEEELLAAMETKTAADDEIILTDAEGRRYCRVRDCDQISAVEGYCRYHYLLLWKKIQARRKILMDGKLGRYVEELTSRYPDKFLEMIRKDLRAEKDFLAAIAELEIDESANENEFEDEAQTFIDEVRGLTPESGTMTEEDDF